VYALARPSGKIVAPGDRAGRGLKQRRHEEVLVTQAEIDRLKPLVILTWEGSEYFNQFLANLEDTDQDTEKAGAP
jgi:hypothetical protein